MYTLMCVMYCTYNIHKIQFEICKQWYPYKNIFVTYTHKGTH